LNNFFITGLPRSRTAWLAAFLSAHHDVWCWHEGLKGCHSKAQFVEKMRPSWAGMPAESTIGNADSVLPLTNFQRLFPGAATVIIHRSLGDVYASTKRLFGPLPDESRELLDETHVKMQSLEGFHVEFENLDVLMPSICSHIGIEYRQDIHMLFKDFNIQTLDLAPDPEALAVWRG
jgi:hypothetical protein